jgi:hypothetical protein
VTRARAMGIAAGVLWLAAAITFGTGVAKADGVLDRAEQWDGDTYGLIYCEVLDDIPTVGGVAGVLDGIAKDGFDQDSSVDVLGYVIGKYCPRHNPLWGSVVGFAS